MEQRFFELLMIGDQMGEANARAPRRDRILAEETDDQQMAQRQLILSGWKNARRAMRRRLSSSFTVFRLRQKSLNDQRTSVIVFIQITLKTVENGDAKWKRLFLSGDHRVEQTDQNGSKDEEKAMSSLEERKRTAEHRCCCSPPSRRIADCRCGRE